MKHLFEYTGEAQTFPLFPGKYRITLSNPAARYAGDTLKGTIDIQSFTWAFVNVGATSGFNAGATDFRTRANTSAEIIMATPGDSRSGYISGFQGHASHFRGLEFEEISWTNRTNSGEGYAEIEVIEQYEPDDNLFNLKSFYDKGSSLELVLPNNQTNNKILYQMNGIWHEVYTGRDTIIQIDTSITNSTGKIQWHVETDQGFIKVGESKHFIIGGSNEVEATVNINASNRFFGTMDIVPPPYYTHDLVPEKDSLVRKKAPHVNYGNSSSLTIGQSSLEQEEFITYLGYSLDAVPVEKDIDDARIVLSLTRRATGSINIAVYESSDEWAEYAVRWENMPDIEKLIFEDVVTPIEGSKIEINLTEYVTDWYNNSKSEKRSLAIVLFSEDNEEVIYFGSKESSYPPYLKVSYYEVPPNAGVHYLEADTLISRREAFDTPASVNIISQFHVVDTDADVFFVSKHPDPIDIPSDTLISIVDVSDLLADVEFEEKHGEIEASVDTYLRGFELCEAEADFRIDKKNANIEVDADTELSVNDYYEVPSDLEFEKKDVSIEVDADVSIRAFAHSEVSSYAEFFKKYSGHQTDASVELRAYGNSDAPSDVEFTKKEEEITIEAVTEFHAKEMFYESSADTLISVRWAHEVDAIVDIEVNVNDSYAFFL